MTRRRALITGITGQDGSYLAEFLLSKDYEVFGFVRSDTWYRPNRVSHIAGRITPIFGDMAEGADISSAIVQAAPDEIYNLASQSRPSESWHRGPETLVVNSLAAIRLFEAVRHHRSTARVYHASSSEMFGPSDEASLDESATLNPSSPYGAAKAYAHQMAGLYRRRYDLFIAAGIMFNHESERRPLHFLTQKVAYGAACAALGIKRSRDQNETGRPIVDNGQLALGNLSIARDWGYAPDFATAMWLMLQHTSADDFVVGTGRLCSLRELCETAYSFVGKEWQSHVVADSALVRALETGRRPANWAKARTELRWAPSVGFEEMIERMVTAQLDALRVGPANDKS